MNGRPVLLTLCFFAPLLARANTIESSESVTTKQDIFAIRDALKFYQKEYGYLPPTKLPIVLQILQGQNTQGYNWKKIVFWERREDTKRFWMTMHQGNVSSKGELLDGWGNPLKFDTDPITGVVEMWSQGKDGKWDKATAIERDFHWTLK